MKDDIRKRLKKQRAELSLDVFNDLSSAIATTVKESEVFINAKNIGFYHSVRGEANPSSLRTSDKQFFLPALSKNKDQGLIFIELTDDTQFNDNEFAIPEPCYKEDKTIETSSLDLIIIPLLAFDKNGNRLGMGGGFYDRCFSFRKNIKTKPLLMGYAYDFQEVGYLNPEPWDIGLDMIATENRLIIPQ